MNDEIRRAIDTIPGFVWSARPDGSVDFLNQRWCDYTGISLQDASGDGWRAAIHSDDLPTLLDDWSSVLARREPGEFEARLRRADGAYRWFLIRAVPMRDECGRVVKWYGQHTDIEDRKQAETLLAGEKRLLELIAMGCELPMVLDSLCTLVDQTSTGSYCSILLVEPDGRTVRHAAAPGLPPAFTRAIDGRSTSTPYWGPCAMAIDRRTAVMVPDIGQDDRWHVEWRRLAMVASLRSCCTTPILSKTGAPLGTFAIYQRDGSPPQPVHADLIARFTHIASIAIERAHAEAALRRHEAILSEAERLSLTGSSCWRPPSDELIWSKEMFRIFDFDPIVTPTVHMVRERIHPEDLPHFNHIVECAVRDGCDFAVEPRLLMPDGTIKHLQVLTHAFRDEHGRVTEFIGAVKDVTDQKRSEDALNEMRSQLAHAARVATLGALTASIAHEINQPLAGIITNASTSLLMLADGPPDITGAMNAAERTIRDANRAHEVIARLRALFRKRTVASEPVDVNEATREVLALLTSELQKAQVTVLTELGTDGLSVIGDRVQLQQVILNLVLNAAEAMKSVDDRARQLVVKTELEGADRVRLSVRDTGPGFDEADVHKLFETFYTTKHDGMGIGLSISRSIIESHEGRLWAAANDGPGATFVLSIPRHAAP